jgi:hypothetical protein
MVKIGTQDVKGKISGGRVSTNAAQLPRVHIRIVLEHTYEYNAKSSKGQGY